MTIKSAIVTQFLEILNEQGFNIDLIAPFLACIIYDEFGNETQKPDTEGTLRFEVRYPGMSPICQYCQWAIDIVLPEGKVIPRNEWFISQGNHDAIFNRDEGESVVSFYEAFKFASVAPTLIYLGMDPKKSVPWSTKR